MDQSNLKYKNLTISGLPGAGSSTLGKALAKTLGWEYFSGGDFMRRYAVEKGLFDGQKKSHHDATVYNDDFDRQVDFGMRETVQKKSGKILDSWLSGFMTIHTPETLRILVFCSDDSVRGDRIVNRDNLSIETAKKHIFEREQKNVSKWRLMYAKQWQEWVVGKKLLPASMKVWFWYPELYDLTIDTYKNSKEETLKIALQALGHYGKINYKSAFKE
ncbi:MAG: hypothetical protein ACD_57C00104G0002 [uncultured bacterium]|nr:MAG: hypothetical protein ACD_57C00104G0002 [uncultured bacterium]